MFARASEKERKCVHSQMKVGHVSAACIKLGSYYSDTAVFACNAAAAAAADVLIRKRSFGVWKTVHMRLYCVMKI